MPHSNKQSPQRGHEKPMPPGADPAHRPDDGRRATDRPSPSRPPASNQPPKHQFGGSKPDRESVTRDADDDIDVDEEP